MDLLISDSANQQAQIQIAQQEAPLAQSLMSLISRQQDVQEQDLVSNLLNIPSVKGSLIELYGESGTGKSQVALHLASKYKTLYIAMDGFFRADRLHLINSECLDNVLVIECYWIEVFESLLIQLPGLIQENGIKLVIFDSIAAVLRYMPTTNCLSQLTSQIDDSSSPYWIHYYAMKLKQIAFECQIDIVCINQVSSVITDDVLNTKLYKPALGQAWTSALDLRVHVLKAKDQTRTLKVEKSYTSSPGQQLQFLVEENAKKFMEETVKVIVRARPSDGQSVVQIKGDQVIADGKKFVYDRVYNNTASQSQIFESVQQLVSDCMRGYSGTVFAYGQTNSGKTYTLTGDTGEHMGVIPRAFNQIFAQIKEDTSYKYMVYATFMEIYNEEVKDLLSQASLDIKEGPNGFFVKGLSRHVVNDLKDILKLMVDGNKLRSVGSTAMNEHSSRSHSILTVYVESCSLESKDNGVTVGKLNLVDLAGSERQSKTQSTGIRLKEATKINLSLAALGNCISALTSKDVKHIPYRDSKLTKLLMDSLGGSAKTVMIATISTSESNLSETISTLRYAQRAKEIKNKPKVNANVQDSMLNEFQTEIEKLRLMVQAKNNGTDKSQLDKLQKQIDDERKLINEKFSMSIQERNQTELTLNQKQLELQQEKLTQQEMAAQLQQLESHDDDIALQVRTQNLTLQQQQENIKKEAQLQGTLTARVEVSQKTGAVIQGKHSSMQDEVQSKREKLRKLMDKTLELRTAVASKQLEQKKQSQLMSMNLYELGKEQKLYEQIAQQYIPDRLVQRLLQRCIYDEKQQDWTVKGYSQEYIDSIVNAKPPKLTQDKFPIEVKDLIDSLQFEDLEVPKFTVDDILDFSGIDIEPQVKDVAKVVNYPQARPQTQARKKFV